MKGLVVSWIFCRPRRQIRDDYCRVARNRMANSPFEREAAF